MTGLSPVVRSKTFPNLKCLIFQRKNSTGHDDEPEAASPRNSKSGRPSHPGRPGPRGGSGADVRASPWAPSKIRVHHPHTALPARPHQILSGATLRIPNREAGALVFCFFGKSVIPASDVAGVETKA
jgi:hypothetical protein